MLQTSLIKFKKIFFLFLVFSNYIHSSSFQEQFCNLYIPHAKSEFHFPDKSPIGFKNQSSYFLFVMKWQQKMSRGFLKFFTQLQDDLQISIQELHELFSNENIVQEFKEYLNQKLVAMLNDPETVTEESMNSYLRNTLAKSIEKFIPYKNITFITTPNIHNLIDIYFDTTKDKYVICFNANVYNLESIRNINNCAHKKSSYYFYYQIYQDQYNYMLYGEFINSGFIIASSFIYHQLTLVLFILINYKFAGKMAHYKTIMLLKRLISFQTDLEIILQSTNPLETAYFYSYLDPFKENNEIWELLIKDISDMYSPNSLAKFQKIRQAAQKKL